MSQHFTYRSDYPVVDTIYGKLRGYELNGIFTFKGIKYADAKRFQSAQPVQKWEGIKDAVNFGPVAPMYGRALPSGELLGPHRYWVEDENCQYLNIWTNTLDRTAKKPVIVWFHGGGFSHGSSLEHVSYDGDALVETGDIVFVSLNHRLNILGYLDLSAFGEKYKNSVNAGVTDLVEALKWVHDNIEAFGGDPQNVTIFGQSGGGGKVYTLMQTPAADGLYHKAMIMSGTDNFNREKDPPHEPVVREMLRLLDIPEDQPEQLEKISYRTLMKTYIKAARNVQIGINFGPVANDYYLGHPCDSGFTEYAKKVPTVVGTVIAEFGGFQQMSGIRMGVTPLSSEEEKMDAARVRYKEHTEEIADLFKKAYPHTDLSVLSKIDYWVRPGAVKFMRDRAASSPEAPCYSYQFTLIFDVLDGLPAWHCADIAFMFHNTKVVPSANMGDVTDRLEKEMSGALLSLAKTGDPNHDGLPLWKPFTLENEATMEFGTVTECRDHLDTELLDAILKFGPPSAILKAQIPRDYEER